jgi:phage shock protein PspC (stress-responsive transcriptional regulator)
MNKVITINLNGNAYQLEESGYEALRDYLDHAARSLAGNPDRDEIVADIEQAIAEKFRAGLGAHRTVVATKDVERVIAEMGPVDDGSGKAGTASAGPADVPPPPPPPASGVGGPRRLFLIREGAMIGGVCNGIAAYVGIDVTIVRLLFVLLCLGYGAGIGIYLLLMILLPTAQTPDERASAGSLPKTAQEFIRRAKEGYYEGMKTFHDKRAHRAWKRKFKQEMRGWKQDFKREMNEHAQHWRHNWHDYWADRPRPALGSWVAVPIVALLAAVVVFGGFFSVLSLIFSRSLFGVALPHGLPLWLGLVMVVLACQFILWQLHAIRHALLGYGCAGRRPFAPILWLWDSALSVGVAVLLLWLATRHWPEVRQGLAELPAFLRGLADSVKHWWQAR